MRKVLLFMLALTLPAVGGSAAWSRSSAVAPSVAPCNGSALSGTFKVIPGSAGAGSISYRLTLVNGSRSRCFVTGIPRLVLLDRKGKALPTAVRPAARGVGTAAMIQLAPGSAATADGRFSPDVPGAGEQHPGACEKTAYWLRVSPAPGRGSLRAPISPPTPVCEKGTMTFTLLKAAPTFSSSYCSPSGDVCVQVLEQKSDVLLEISTMAKYFTSYRLCVRGPKSRVCRSFPMHAAGSQYDSTVSWKKNFPDQGHGTYRATWSYSAKTLSFTR